MRRVLGILIAIVVAGALSGPVVAARPEPRVAVIVGPVGGLTNLYRSVGTAAAREARRWTSDVVSVVSPNATWPAVKRALRGASIVIYLGHGNGWPSPYRDALYPPTQDGLGLNPVAGGDDTAHQYFGEAFLARQIRLAPGAVVLLHHLCYASGNSEPGLAEGSLEVAKQRVDNYAAGWLAAGAGAVIADTFGDPGPYLRGLLGTDEAIDRIWRDAPTFHDHVLTFPSTRSPGFVAAIDPTRSDSGFNRSIVSRPGLDAAQVRDGAGRVATLPIGGRTTEEPVLSLASLGVTFRAPGLVAAGATPTGLVAGTRANLILPVKTPTGVSLPDQLALGVRWDPLVVDTAGSAAPGTPGATPSPSPSPTPGPSPSSRGRPIPGAVPSATPEPLIQPPGIDPIAPEVLGSVVTPARTLLYHGRLLVTLQLPDAPGTYRLVTTVHGADGVAFDGATQALVPAVVVRVSRALSVAFGVVPNLTVETGAKIALPIRVANDGALAWADRPDMASSSMDALDPRVTRARPSARLVARWVPLATAGSGAPAPLEASMVVAVDPGSELTVRLSLVAPAAPGSYLLVLDVDSPLHGSLAASGAAPGQVRVTVEPAATPVAP
jgi:hypothetical protein